MRSIPGALLFVLLAGCTRSSTGHADPPNVAPDPTPISVAPVSPASKEGAPLAGGDPTGAPASDPGEAPAGDPPAAPLPSCSLSATLRDAGPKSDQRFSVVLKNEGSKPLRLVLPGDGSAVGWRTPVVTWTASANGAPVAPEGAARCGMMNRIEPSEIVTLAPGASREMRDWLDAPRFAPGTYDLRLTYRNDPALQARKSNGESDEVKRLIAASSACEVTSKPLRVTLH